MERYRSPGDMPVEIPLFPLLGAILLPRSELPLNVFEPRYLEMVDDAIRGERMIGIIQPESTTASAGMESPAGKVVPLKRIGCVGRITTFQELADGRMRIGITGIARFVMVEELAARKPYRIAKVDFRTYAGDFAEDDSAASVDREQLMKVLKSYLTARKLEADWNMIARAPLEPLVNGLSTMSPFGPEEKQALLEAADIKHRADVLIALAEMATASSHETGGGTLQ